MSGQTIDSGALLGTCAECEHWEPEPHHRLWGRCGRRDDKMRYGARSYYPYDCKPVHRLRDGWEISTYKDFGCNRHVPNAQVERTQKADKGETT